MIPVYKFALREDLKENKEFLPTRAEPKATGWDVRAAMHDHQAITVKPFEYVKIPLGFRAFCPKGWWLSLKPRSSTFAKKKLHCLYGTIDETFEGEMVFAGQYIPDCAHQSNDWMSVVWNWLTQNRLEIKFGEAIGQLIPIERQDMEVVEIGNEEYDAKSKERDAVRKTGGFGSTSS